MSKKITAEEAAKNLKTRMHHLPVAAARKMARKFQKFRKALLAARDAGAKVPPDTPDIAICYSFNLAPVQKLLAQKKAAGLRIYLAINESKELTPVLVAFDKSGQNITGSALTAAGISKSKKQAKDSGDDDGVLDDGQGYPPYPAPPIP
jgi:hypothetical protein